jgi:short-subunit dehydrogenase
MHAPPPSQPDADLRVDLSGSTALVTGASRGVGAHLASTLAASGAAVALTGRDETGLREVEERIRENGGRAVTLPHDLLDFGATGALLDRVEAALGPVDLLVNNAGTSVTGRATDVSEEDFDRVFRTNVKAAFALSCETARRLIAREHPGGNENIATNNGHQPRPALSVY